VSTRSTVVAQKPAAPVLSSQQGGVLQHKRACGQHLNGGECSEGKKQGSLQRSSSGAAGPAVAPPIVHDVLRSPGEPLQAGTRTFFEKRFTGDFSTVPTRSLEAPAGNLTISSPSDPFERAAESVAERVVDQDSFAASSASFDFRSVRVHRDARAAEAARAINARAFTVGQDVVFDAGEYQPNSQQGRRLLAHELAHVLQQSGSAAASTVFRQPALGTMDPTIQTPPPPVPPETVGRSPGEKKDAQSPEKKASGAVNTRTDAEPGDDAAFGSGPGLAKAESSHSARGAAKSTAVPPGVKAPADASSEPVQNAGGAEPNEPQSRADRPLSDLPLIDQELAEHERWGAAAETVGTAGSKKRAEFIAGVAAEGSKSGLIEGLKGGLTSGVGLKVAEKVAEKALVLGVKLLSSKAGNFVPVPGLGAAIGGAMAAYDLASRDWSATGESLGKFGRGADIYDTLANSIEAASTALEVATQVLNVIAGVLGAITVIMWAATVATAGVLSPVAGTLTLIAAVIQIGAMILDAINALVLKRLITLFRSLHSFTSEADPRDVVTQGKAIEQAAAGTTGFLGGVAGGFAVEGGAKLGKKGLKAAGWKSSTPVPDHPLPPAASGDGPTIKAEAPLAPKEVGSAAAPVDKTPQVRASATGETAAAPEVKNVPADTAAAPAVEAKGIEEGKAEPQPVTEAKGAAKKKGSGRPRKAAPTRDMGEPLPREKGATQRSGHEPEAPAKRGKKISRSEERQRLGQKFREGTLTDAELERLATSASMTPEQLKDVMLRAEIKRAGDPTGFRDKDVVVAPGEKQKAFLRKNEKMPGRTKYADNAQKRIEGHLRKTVRIRFGFLLRDVLTGAAREDNLTRAALERLGEPEKDFIRENGRLPGPKDEAADTASDEAPNTGVRAVDVHHLLAIADFPEFGEKPEVAIPLLRDLHKWLAHGGDTTRPIEAATFLGNEGEGRAQLTETKEGQKGARLRTNRRIAEGVAASTEKQGGIDRDLVIEARDKPRQLERELALLRENKKQRSTPSIDKKIARKQVELSVARERANTIESVVAARGGPPVPDATPTAGSLPPHNSPSLAFNQAPTHGAEIASGVPAVSTTAPQVAEPVPVNVSPADEVAVKRPGTDTQSDKPEAELPPKPEEALPKSEAEPTDQEPAQTDELLKAGARLGTAARQGAREDTGDAEKEEPFAAGLRRNLGIAAHMDPRKLSTAEKVAYVAGGPFAGALAVDAMQGFEKASSEPIVEHVNPNYPVPPYVPQNVVDTENEILRTNDARGEAVNLSNEMAAQKAHHGANVEPLKNMQKRTDDAINATAAHAQTVDKRMVANDKKQENENQVSAALSDYSNRAARLTTLTDPLRQFARFTSLAQALPDNPDFVLRVKQGILKMNSDSRRFLGQLESVDTTISSQKGSQPERGKEVQADRAALQQTDQKAKQSDQTFDQAKEKTAGLEKDNKAKLEEAAANKQQADQSAARLDAHAEQKEAEAESMQSALQTWAPAHVQARVSALEQTKESLESKGYKIVEVKPL
jgi:hypothetical protein